jgi:type VI secretion system secreted protein VgrG
MAISQDGRLLQITTPLGKDFLLLTDFHGEEGISKLFRFDLSLAHEEPNSDTKPTLINFDSVVGKNVTIRIAALDGSERFINGYIASFSQGGRDDRFSYYRAVLVPSVWFLSRESDCRVFQNMTVPDIVKSVFSDLGLQNVRDALAREYTAWDYCTQYHETNLNFVCRLMEEEGISYFFEHENGKHTLVLADLPNAYRNCPGTSDIPFVTDVDNAFGQTVLSWQVEQELRPGKYTLRDHHFEMPRKPLEFTQPTIIDLTRNKSLEMYDYPGDYAKRFNNTGQRLGKVEPEGTSVTEIRMEEEESPGLVSYGSSNYSNLTSGFAFKLKNHPASVNGRYVVTSIRHSAVQTPNYVSGVTANQPYNNSFVCISDQIHFRPPRVTPKPLMQGPQTAVVVGKTGEEIWTDIYGRVKVQFFCDRKGKLDEKSSCWVRVSQVWAGKQWGCMHMPRIGQEVIVDFLHGDPDQPIIIGRVYNADQMPPYDLPANQTQSGIKTRSSKKGASENFNEIRFEDKKDHEDLLIHAERTMHNSVEASQYITVGGSRHITTGGVDKDGNKQGDVKELVFKNHNLHVKADERTKIEGESHLHVQDEADATYDKDLVQSITGKCVILADTIQLQGTTKLVLMAGTSSIVIDASGVTVLGTPLINLNSPGVPPTPEIIPLVVDPDDPEAG